jgi:hypothetical protein
MAEIAGFETGVDVASFASSTIGIWLLMGLGIIVMLAITAIFLWWYFQRRLYKFKIVVFENISGQGWQNTMIDTAKHIRLSKDGTEVFWLRKKKMPLTAYGRKMGTNKYWFAIGQDGGWYNIVLGDLDAKKSILDIEPVDRDIKYVSVAMRKNAAENYGPKITFMDKYGSWILGGVTLIIFFGGIWFMLNQIGEITQGISQAADSLSKTTEPIMRALGHVDSICSGGTGLSQA